MDYLLCAVWVSARNEFMATARWLHNKHQPYLGANNIHAARLKLDVLPFLRM